MAIQNYKSCVVTGGAGLIGSKLVSALHNRGMKAKVLDDFSTKRLETAIAGIELVKGDVENPNTCKKEICADIVFHLAGYAKVKEGFTNPGDVFKKNIMGALNVLEAMRVNDFKSIAFTSSATVYGDLISERPNEDFSPLVPSSIYGASKLACENLICGYCKTYGFRAYIFRLSNIVSYNSSHGVIRDFVLNLRKNPKEMKILGNGMQQRSFVYVDDCVLGMLCALDKATGQISTFNISNKDQITIREVAEIVSSELGLKPVFSFEKASRGWVGDLKSTLIDTSRLESLGWKCSLDSRQVVKRCVREMGLGN